MFSNYSLFKFLVQGCGQEKDCFHWIIHLLFRVLKYIVQTMWNFEYFWMYVIESSFSLKLKIVLHILLTELLLVFNEGTFWKVCMILSTEYLGMGMLIEFLLQHVMENI